MNFFSRKNLLGETQTVTCRIERDPTSGSFGLSLNDHNRITKVAKGSPSEKAKLIVFDRIIKVDGAPLKEQACEAAAFLSGATEPFLAGYTRDERAHAVFVVPVTTAVLHAVDSPSELAAARTDAARDAMGAAMRRSLW